MRILVSSVNKRAGKTSLICSLSRFAKFKYEKRGAVRGAEHLLPPEDTSVVVEGGETYKAGFAEGKSDIHENVDKVVLIARYESGIADELVLAAEMFGDRFAAAVINCAPDSLNLDLPIETVGVVPYSRKLGSIGVETIARQLNGRVVVRSDVSVDEFLVGAMSSKCAAAWLERKKNAALVTGGDRVDLQKLALDMGVKCLILTGGMEPPKVIVKRAEELGVAVILSDHDTLTSLEKIQEGINEPLSASKVNEAVKVFSAHVDFDRLTSLLGLK